MNPQVCQYFRLTETSMAVNSIAVLMKINLLISSGLKYHPVVTCEKLQ